MLTLIRRAVGGAQEQRRRESAVALSAERIIADLADTRLEDWARPLPHLTHAEPFEMLHTSS